uniref:Intraflagellar transport protein 74 homolog n=1 Tax=Panagrellus redivivus TaxID=6233 RepID=A0A7E4VHI3_PANRE
MERPPSSRPRTGSNRPGTAKRPKTAGRNLERPPTAVLERPVSRKASISTSVDGSMYDGAGPVEDDGGMVVPPTRAFSRAGPSSYANRQIASRMGTAMGGRPVTGSRILVPPGTGAARPVTQQGLAGVRAVSRAGTAFGNRIIMDKTYFMSLLNTQLAALNEETSSLMSELEKFEQEQQKLLLYEQKAEEGAEELKHLIGELSDHNLLIERQNVNYDLADLQYEVQEEETKNAELSEIVEKLFRDRREKEDYARLLERQVEEIRLSNQDLVNSMDPGIRDEYEMIKAEAERLEFVLAERQNEVDELTKRKEELDVALANSPLKQQAMILQEQIAELDAKRNEIKSEINDEASPEVLRERMVQQIKKDNEEISFMQSMISELQNKQQQIREELAEFNNEAALMASETNEKYKELTLKEAQIDEFVSTYDARKAAITETTENLGNEVIHMLRLISLNCASESGLDTLNVRDIDEVNLESANDPEELQDLHLELQEQLVNQDMAILRMQTELESLNERDTKIHAEMETFGDISALQKEIMEKRSLLIDQKDQLENEISNMEAQIRHFQTDLKAIEDLLKANPDFQKKEILEEVKQERDELQNKVATKQAEIDYDDLKVQAMRLREQYNEVLKQNKSTGYGR